MKKATIDNTSIFSLPPFCLSIIKLLNNVSVIFNSLNLSLVFIRNLLSNELTIFSNFFGIKNNNITPIIERIKTGIIALLYSDVLFGSDTNDVKKKKIKAIASKIFSIIIAGMDCVRETLSEIFSINGFATSVPLPGVKDPADTPAIIEANEKGNEMLT